MEGEQCRASSARIYTVPRVYLKNTYVDCFRGPITGWCMSLIKPPSSLARGSYETLASGGLAPSPGDDKGFCGKQRQVRRSSIISELTGCFSGRWWSCSCFWPGPHHTLNALTCSPDLRTMGSFYRIDPARAKTHLTAPLGGVVITCTVS